MHTEHKDSGLEELAQMAYPGRFIIMGRDEKGEHNVVIYGITSRSKENQERRLVSDEQDKGVHVRPTDPGAMKRPDAALIFYPALFFSEPIIVSNGVQSDGIHTAIEKEGALPPKQRTTLVHTLKAELAHWEYEPDKPKTPRITGMLTRNAGVMRLSIIKCHSSGGIIRGLYEYPLQKGKGKLLATYDGPDPAPGQLIPSFIGEPRTVELQSCSIEEMTERVYDALMPDDNGKDYRVAVAVLYAWPHSSRRQLSIKNREGTASCRHFF